MNTYINISVRYIFLVIIVGLLFSYVPAYARENSFNAGSFMVYDDDDDGSGGGVFQYEVFSNPDPANFTTYKTSWSNMYFSQYGTGTAHAARVTACLSADTLWYNSLQCWHIYEPNDVTDIEPAGERNLDDYDPNPIYPTTYVIYEIFARDTVVSVSNPTAYGKTVSIDNFLVNNSNTNPISVNTGQQFDVSWDTSGTPTAFIDKAALFWTGPVSPVGGGNSGDPVQPSEVKSFTATGPGTVTFTLCAVGWGPFGSGYVGSAYVQECTSGLGWGTYAKRWWTPDDRTVEVDNTPNPPPGSFILDGGCYGWSNPNANVEVGLSSLSSGASTYHLERQSGSFWNEILSAPASDGINAVDFSELATAGAVYDWRVRAHNSSGDSYSNVVSYTVNSPSCGGGAPPPTSLSNQSVIITSTPGGPPVSSINPDGSTVYYITESVNDSAGGTNVSQMYALVNYQGSNGGYPNDQTKGRGYLTFDKNGGAGIVCTDTNGQGNYGRARKESSWGSAYMNLVSCTTSYSGTNRTVTFGVSFNTNFGTDGPQTNNDISGIADDDNAAISTSWNNFETNFGLSVNTLPSMVSILINPKPINPNGSFQYTVTATASDTNGAGDITSQYGIINYQGPNANSHKGYFGWSTQNFPLGWAGNYKAGYPIPASSGGGQCAIYYLAGSDYGAAYINLLNCNSSVSGNTRTTVFTVSFNTNFTAPPTQNVVSGLAQDAVGHSGWFQGDSFDLGSGSTQSLTVSVNPGPGGSITSSPAGINCGSTCSASFTTNSIVTLTATPASSYWKFNGWGITGGGPAGDCSGIGLCTLQLTGQKTASASFVPRQFNYIEF